MYFIQHDWPLSIKEASKNGTSTLWINYIKGKVDETDTITITKQKGSSYTFKWKIESIKHIEYDLKKQHLIIHDGESGHCQFVAPKKSWGHLHGIPVEKFDLNHDNLQSHSKRDPIYSLDISPKGGMLMSGSTEGSVRVATSSSGQLMRDLDSHVGDMYDVKFLPSGKVAMTAGADTQIKIWDLQEGSALMSQASVTFVGHQGGINRIQFIDRGRNFVSASNDGTAALWDCASQSRIVQNLFHSNRVKNPIRRLHDAALFYQPQDNEIAPVDRRDFHQHGYIAALTSPFVTQLVDIASRSFIVNLDTKEEANAVHWVSSTTVVMGCESGILYVYDIRQPKSPLFVSHEQPSSFTTLAPFGSQSLLCATKDGHVYSFNVSSQSFGDIVLTGPHLDVVHDLAVYNQGDVYSCSRDGFVRSYDLHP
mmetsp:Transcript_10481/g.15324  ORF Transcript_10481/g.15324 Transcript_10481/m.15324 type:complete len:423 (-) Transcript_10481:596-1864(-)